MQAMFSLSLGAMCFRPRTCEGTIVKATLVDATSPTNVRREILSVIGEPSKESRKAQPQEQRDRKNSATEKTAPGFGWRNGQSSDMMLRALAVSLLHCG